MDDAAARGTRRRRVDTAGAKYEVGYGKPPVHTRFKPGQSGNPFGRPRGARTGAKGIPDFNEERMKRIIQEEAYRLISVRDGDRLVEIPVIQAILRSIALSAAKGHQRSQRMFSDLLQSVERENKALYDEWLKTAINYKVEWQRELERRERCGETGPEPIPHPDHIVINMHTGLIEMRGPLTPEDKPAWDRLREQKVDLDELIATLERMATEDPENPEIRPALTKLCRERTRIAKILPD